MAPDPMREARNDETDSVISRAAWGRMGSGISFADKDEIIQPSSPSGKTFNRSVSRFDLTTSLSPHTTMSKRSSTRLRCRKRFANCTGCSRKIVDNSAVTGFVMLLTVYALTGDDVRMLFTDKPADIVFNMLTIGCIVVFALELVLSCIGKEDYFGGFFFFLDAISTVTLVLDLTWVSDSFADDSELDGARSGRTARMGARIGRVVRVLRLVRIAKLYKGWHDAKRKRERALQLHKLSSGIHDDDGWDGLAMEDGTEDKNTTESLVGKKLSALTTQRVIVLVLTMLICLPLLRADSWTTKLPDSASYGAEDVMEEFMMMMDGISSRSRYEQTLLRYIYYHNWFLYQSGCPPLQSSRQSCSANYYSHIFWMGIASDNADLRRTTGQAASLSSQAVQAWEAAGDSRADHLFLLGSLPAQAQETLSSEWVTECELSTDELASGVSLLAHKIDGYVTYRAKCPSDLRVQERTLIYPRLVSESVSDMWRFVFFFDSRPYSKMEAAFSVGVTCFVCVVLCVASVLLSDDANRLVLAPLEKMITKVEAIRRNPLAAIKMADDEHRAEEIRRFQESQKPEDRWRQCWMSIKKLIRRGGSRPKSEPMETVVLEKTLIKLGSLLAIGFGEAGANIVTHNMSGQDSAGVNAMVPGVRVDCIIGVARICDFATATEVLQGKIMTFVNQIAEIVHGLVDEYHGAANKNNGDTFLLVWRMEEAMDSEKLSRLADMSIVAFARVLGAVHKSPVLGEYRTHPGLQQRLGSQLRVNLRFGLHCGWAIEGALGSEFKIDASYISPNVSIAGSAEGATSAYGVSLIATDSVWVRLSRRMRVKCRVIDRVIIRGSKVPLDLYGFDLDYMCLKVRRRRVTLAWNPRQRFRARQLLEVEKNNHVGEGVELADEFDKHYDLGQMRNIFTTEFLHRFNMGFLNYVHGEWQVARRVLSQTRMMLGVQDGPSCALLRFMQSYDYEAPDTWDGVHYLDEPGGIAGRPNGMGRSATTIVTGTPSHHALLQ
mmetsp:Transcript_23680/g.55238  ORF Transcript_23680/g.55238 Transcript_23680/m.55238 type:complete len:1002 (-) Transcript_23680:128-3133(-)|eukprot:CAMPEP_0178382116 /NCGR_PEP_ID=MMETSP0689_2-20121128/6330_1 /TAXON_ID=160604 /ORGANISM="Amphidinium massartii, Strain CS-259" /LENGTH=1001 /DNA_ID=CAMNT_0020002315 /DNA_START=114 /DNA_END=3119 /DNA_ORIENTATION=+